MRAFFWTHGGHLLTKPLLAAPLWWGAHLLLAPWLAVAVALVLPAAYSAARKARLWPGCLRTLAVWQDEFADTWAAAVLVLPLALDTMPLVYRVVFGLAMAGVLWPGGLHRWALP